MRAISRSMSGGIRGIEDRPERRHGGAALRPLWLMAALAFVGACASSADAQTVERVSLNSDGEQGNSHSGWDLGVSLSGDGRFVAFSSVATNLAPLDKNINPDIYVRDRQAGTTELASVLTSGEQILGSSTQPAISADGRFVAFRAKGSNLPPGGSGFDTNAYVHDRETGTTEAVSVDIPTTTGTIQGAGEPSLSADGRFVAFPGNESIPRGNIVNVFIRDRQAGQTVQLTQYAPDDSCCAWGINRCVISNDGRSVAYDRILGASQSSVWIVARETGIQERVDVSTDGVPGLGSLPAILGGVSSDGRYVAFVSASPLASEPKLVEQYAYVRDRQAGTTERIPIPYTAEELLNDAYGVTFCTISGDGRYVVLAGHVYTKASGEVFFSRLYDRQSGRMRDLPAAGRLSSDGQYLVFTSQAADLVPGDTNGEYDVFVYGPLGSGPLPYTLQDAAAALRGAGGLETVTGFDRLNVSTDGASANRVDLDDAIRIARKVAGLDPNP